MRDRSVRRGTGERGEFRKRCVSCAQVAHHSSERRIRAAIAAIGEDAWKAIEYPQAIWDGQLNCWTFDAEATYTAFTSKEDKGDGSGPCHDCQGRQPDPGRDQLVRLVAGSWPGAGSGGPGPRASKGESRHPAGPPAFASLGDPLVSISQSEQLVATRDFGW
jgi:hypothetical protein